MRAGQEYNESIIAALLLFPYNYGQSRYNTKMVDGKVEKMKIRWRRLFLVIFIAIVVCLLLISILIGFFYAATRRQGPLSLDEVLTAQMKRGLPPLYYPDPASNYANLNVVYYYQVKSARVIIDTYFTTTNSSGEVIRVAKLVTHHVSSGPSVNLLDKEVSISWADDGIGRVCEASSEAEYDDLVGPPYQSCLFWFNENRHALYTIWPEKESVGFANSLSEAERSNVGEP